MQTVFDWGVIGAGPAGIAVVGKLIDNGVPPEKILWIDPEFQVGDFGTKWRYVSSNTRVRLFTKFLTACHAFNYPQVEKTFALSAEDPEHTCSLGLAAEPLQWVTNHLQTKVRIKQGHVQQLQLMKRQWHLKLQHDECIAKNVVLAIGAEPKSLTFPNITEIPMTTALHPEQLKATCTPDDTIAVFGSSHSAILILKTLLETCAMKKVINFYLLPLRYAVYMDDWILFDDSGLKGKAAEWARNSINGTLPAKLERLVSNEENLRTALPECTKAIYATGFEKRHLSVAGLHRLDYHDRTGIIAPGLFGVGIAFPEGRLDPYGTLEYRVGIWKFMDYIHRIMPVWLKYGT